MKRQEPNPDADEALPAKKSKRASDPKTKEPNNEEDSKKPKKAKKEQSKEKFSLKEVEKEQQQMARKPKRQFNNASKKSNYMPTLNLKGKYKDRFLGKINAYKTRYLPNGKPRPFTKKGKDRFVKQEDVVDDLAPATISVEQINQIEISKYITKENIHLTFLNPAARLLLLASQESIEELKSSFSDRFDRLIRDPLPATPPFCQQTLQKYFGFASFHRFQEEALEKLRGGNVLVNSFTGSGKSLIFQYRACVVTGITLVVAPYVALIVDQIKRAPEQLPTIALNSWLSYV